MQRFRFFASRLGWLPERVEDFRKLGRIRNEVFHGERTAVSLDVAYDAKDLLVKMLKAELGILGDLSWEKEPKGFGIKVEYRVDMPPPLTAGA